MFEDIFTLAISPIERRTDSSEFNYDAAHYEFTLQSTKAPRLIYRGQYSKGWGNFAKYARHVPRHIASDSAFLEKALRGLVQPTLAVEAGLKAAKPYLQRKFPPTLAEIVTSLCLDAESSDQTFGQWVSDYGYSDDSIKAKQIWETCNDIRRFLESAVPAETLAKLYEFARESRDHGQIFHNHDWFARLLYARLGICHALRHSARIESDD